MDNFQQRGIHLPIEADLVLSLGKACRPAQALRRNHLRTFASPFDWMMNYSLKTISNFFNNGFSTFFKEYTIIDKKNKYIVKDVKSGMLSLHDFPTDKNVADVYPEFIRKMNKRFTQTATNINTSRNILFISNRDIAEYPCFIEFINDMHDIMYNKNIYILNIHNSKEEEININYINKSTLFFDIRFHDCHQNVDGPDNPDRWMGNIEKWDWVMKFIKPTYEITGKYN